MTHFETLLVESMRDLATQVQQNNVLCARLDERTEAFEKRLEALEAAMASPPSSASRRSRVTAKDATLGAGVFVALATAILNAITTPSASPPAPRPPVAAEAAQK